MYTPFCLHPYTSMLQVLSLDYLIAMYPLALVIITYAVVTLHYNNCKLVVFLWRPFLRCCIRFRRQWDIQNSLVDAFATFLLLSYVKFLNVSSDILTRTILWDDKVIMQRTVLYYDGTVRYFGEKHLPYAVLAITILIIFTLLPILILCFYPCHWFQQLLNRCHLRCLALHTFMDAFQGCYKNGTDGTRDCHFFSALYLITRGGVHFSLVLSSMYQHFISLLVVVFISRLFSLLCIIQAVS